MMRYFRWVVDQYILNPLAMLYIGVIQWPEEEEESTPPQKR